MPSLLDDPLAPQATSLLPGVPALTIAPPDPAQPDVGTGLSDLYNSVTAELARQRQISRDMGLWTGGGLLEGGHPTMAGVADAANKVVQGILMGSTAPEAPGITAFHGSPYDFDKFDIGKIGTGEGAQAYGHGLYFAESPGVAQSYRDNLSRTDYSTTTGARIPDWVGNSIKRVSDQFGSDSRLYGQIIDRHLGDFQARLADEQSRLNTAPDPWNVQDRVDNLSGIVTGLQELRSGDATLQPRGRMYEVNINADPQHFLDWDAPLSEQSQHVQDALAQLNVPNQPHVTGEMAYNHVAGNALLERDMLNKMMRDRAASGDTRAFPQDAARLTQLNNPPAAAASDLQSAGVPGIKYFDQGSRGAGQGTRNYVVFSPDIINIARKYAVPAAVLSGTGAGLVQQGQQPAS